MPTLFLVVPSSKKDQTDIGPDRDGQMSGMNGVSLSEAVLANRYQLLRRVGADVFKAHDLLLDQTVMVRETIFPSECVGNTWRQKAKQLASVRDPRFLNVLDVISERSRDFVVTERPRGQSIADLLGERQGLARGDVLRLVTSLTGALDLAAPYSCCPKAVATGWLFIGKTRHSAGVDLDEDLLPDSPMFIQLDVWELVKPENKVAGPWCASKVRSGGSRGLAVSQAALLTYELLGGEKKMEGHVRRWFKPVHALGKAGNSILRRGLQGSPRFKNSENFLEKLSAAIQTEGRERCVPALTVRPKKALIPTAEDVIRRFNCETRWVSTAVLGAVAFATLVVAVLVPERYAVIDDLTDSPAGRGGELWPSSDPNKTFTAVGSNRQGSTAKTISGDTNDAVRKISPLGNASSETGAEAPNSTGIFESAFWMSRPEKEAKAGFGTLAHRGDSAAISGAKVMRARSRPSGRPKFVSVKTRLLELWHHFLKKDEESRSWATVPNSRKADRKKVSYTAETKH